MNGSLIHGDHVSCSRVGGSMRRESSRLRQHAQTLADSLDNLAADAALAAVSTSVGVLRATADDLDAAGAALQRYATELAEGHELGRRAEQRAEASGLLLEGTRVIEPWGPASAPEAERRRAQVPEVQSRVDLATAHVGRARGRLAREMTRLTEAFSTHSRDIHAVRQGAPPPRGSRPGQHRLEP